MTLFEGAVLVGIAILVAEIGWFVVKFTRAHLAGKAAVPAMHVPKRAVGRLLVIGDSMAYGTGASTGSGSLAGYLAADHPELAVVNQSVNSLRLSQLTKRLSQIEGNYDLALIQIGGMDTLLFTSTKRIRAELRDAFAQARRLGAKFIVLVSVNNVGSLPLFHFPLDRLYTHRSRRVSQSCGEVCEAERVVHVPLFTEKDKDPLARDAKTLFTGDGIHPNNEGYAIWYKMIKTAIEPEIRSNQVKHE